MVKPRKVIVFGLREMAELAHFYLTHDSPYEVIAFCVNGEFIKQNTFLGIPVIALEEIPYSPNEVSFFAPLYANQMNETRKKVFCDIKCKGFQFITYVSSKAFTWNSKIGENCFIFEGCNLQPYTSIGDNNIIWSFSHLGHHSCIGNHNFISGHVVIAGKNVIGDHCFLGTNSCTREELNIADGTLLGQSASLISDTDEWSIYLGVPAKKVLNKSSKDAI